MLLVFLLGGGFSYMGGSDAQAAEAAQALYADEFRRLLLRMWVLDAGVLIAWTAPLGAAFVLAGHRWRRGGGAVLALGVGAAWMSWMLLASLRVPSLLAPSLVGDGEGWAASAVRRVCTAGGPAWLVLSLGSVVLAVAVISSWRLAGVAALFYAAAVGWLWQGEAYEPRTALRPGSILLLVADSLRADHATPAAMPRVHGVLARAGEVRVPEVMPPVARTTPAVVSLLTGRLPAETGVTTMFSNEETFRQVPSLVTVLRDAGYCTVAVGEYPAEMLAKYQLGFERVQVPRARFKEISLQAALVNDPFVLATLSWRRVRTRTGRTLENLVEGLPSFPAPRQLLRRLDAAVAGCGERPVFAFVFGNQPHFPYAQSWPFYVEALAGYEGRFPFGKSGAGGSPKTEEERAHVRRLYAAALRSTDDAYGALLERLESSGQLAHATVVLTGDHGESLYERPDVIGHGDRLGEMDGVYVPWLVLGKGRDAFAGLGSRVQSTRMAGLLARVAGVSWNVVPALPEGVLYLETDMWMADTGGLPPERVRYPELSGVLTVKDKEADIELQRSLLSTIEYAKHRAFWVDGVEYRLEPGREGVTLTRDGTPIRASALPAVIPDFLNRYYPDVAPALLF